MGKLTNGERADARKYVEQLFVDGKIDEDELDEQLADLQPDRGPLKAAIAAGVACLLIGGGFGIEIGHRIATGNAAEVRAAPAATITHTKAVPVTVTAPAPRTTAPPTTSAPRTTPGLSPEVREWMERTGQSRPEAAEEACEVLRKAGDAAPWESVGDQRLIWAGRLVCTEFKEAVERADKGTRYNDMVVGDGDGEMRPGVYATQPGVKNCYWERLSVSGETKANDFVTFAPSGVTVTVRESDGGFSSSNCGPWVPVV